VVCAVAGGGGGHNIIIYYFLNDQPGVVYLIVFAFEKREMRKINRSIDLSLLDRQTRTLDVQTVVNKNQIGIQL